MPSSKLAAVSAAVVLAFTLAACRQAPRKAEASAVAPSLAVPVITVASTGWPSIYEAVGTVRARTSVPIASKVMGYVREVNVKVGDNVTRGELLAVLDARDLDAVYRQAEAGRLEATDARTEAENGVSSAGAHLDLVKATFRRMQDLYDKKSISDQEYDEAKANLKSAQAAYDMAVSRREQVGAKIQQADAAITSADIQRGYAEIRSPLGGVITEKQVEPGSLAVPGAPLLTIEQTGAYRLEAAVEEGRLESTHVGDRVTVKLDAFDQTIPGRVSEIVPSVDPASRAFTVKIDLPSLPHLRSGIFGRAQFTRGTRQVIAIPAAAISRQGQVESVMVVEGGFAHTRLVSTGATQGGQVEVLSGLNPGDQVVSPHQPNLLDGERAETRP
jgi:membrane fusion protein, multidrug efflux system